MLQSNHLKKLRGQVVGGPETAQNGSRAPIIILPTAWDAEGTAQFDDAHLSDPRVRAQPNLWVETSAWVHGNCDSPTYYYPPGGKVKKALAKMEARRALEKDVIVIYDSDDSDNVNDMETRPQKRSKDSNNKGFKDSNGKGKEKASGPAHDPQPQTQPALPRPQEPQEPDPQVTGDSEYENDSMPDFQPITSDDDFNDGDDDDEGDEDETYDYDDPMDDDYRE